MVSVAVYTQLRPRQRLLLLLLLCCRRRTCHGDRTTRQAHAQACLAGTMSAIQISISAGT